MIDTKRHIKPVTDALDVLGVQCRSFPHPEGVLLLCAAGETRFNLMLHADGRLSLWRFLRTAPEGRIGDRLEFRRGDTRCPVTIVLTVNEDQMLVLYCTQYLSNRDETHLLALLRSQIRLLCRRW